MRKLLLFAVAMLVVGIAFSTNCFVYFEGIGCPHCAKVDAYLFPTYLPNHNTLIIEYEIYQDKDNVPILSDYVSKYSGVNGVPQLYYANGKSVAGDTDVIYFLKNFEGSSNCLTLNGSVPINSLNYSALPGSPKIWYKDKAVIIGSTQISNKIVNDFLFGNYTPNGTAVMPIISYSMGSVKFNHAVKVGDWYFYWGRNGTTNKVILNPNSHSGSKLNLNWFTILGLAATDAINPCALAVLTLMLIAIMTYNPKDRRKVLLAGLAFSLTVFVMYFAYGLLIVNAFKLVQQLSAVKSYFVEALAVFAIVIGIFEIKDFVHYKPGTIFTEMPLGLRPKVKKLISGVTSPIGAVFVGAFVTLFLLPCTIGPYFIASGLMSNYPLHQVMPYLLFYNFIFILPMLAITLFVYAGITTVGEVSNWRDKNIRLIHAIAGALMMGIGAYLLYSVL